MGMRIFVLISALLSGCATTIPPDYWHKVAEPIDNIEIVHVNSILGLDKWRGVQGYAIRGPDKCVIVIRKDAANYDCTLAHEKYHCAGYNHDAYPMSLSCVYPPKGNK